MRSTLAKNEEFIPSDTLVWFRCWAIVGVLASYDLWSLDSMNVIAILRETRKDLQSTAI